MTGTAEEGEIGLRPSRRMFETMAILTSRTFALNSGNSLGLIGRSTHSKDGEFCRDPLNRTIKFSELSIIPTQGSTQSFLRYVSGTSTHRQARCDRRNQARRDPVGSWRSGQGQQKNRSLKAEGLALQQRPDYIVENKESSRVGRNVVEHNVPGVFGW